MVNMTIIAQVLQHEPRGGQSHYSDLAIETALTLRAVFRL
jgi:hypothetical protein